MSHHRFGKSVFFPICLMGCFWCHVPSWPGTVATFGHHRVDKYAVECFCTGWGGVGWGWWHCLNLKHMVDATQLCLSCHRTHGGCYATVFVLSLHTWWMLRNRVCLVIAHMVDATQLCLSWTCTWGGVGMMTFFELEHMVDATQLCLSCHCTHGGCYATLFVVNLHVGWGGVWDDDILWTWTHGGCYATLFVLSLHTWWMLRNCVCLVIAHMVDATQLLDYVYQFVYRHNKDLWETTWRSKTTFCVLFHISRTSYKNRKTSDCVVNHMFLDYANVWHHRASRRRVTLFLGLESNIYPKNHSLVPFGKFMEIFDPFFPSQSLQQI